MKQTLLLVLLGSTLAAVYGFACTPNFCASNKCSDAPQSQEDCESPAVFVANGGTCRCCGLCVTYHGEGESCPSFEAAGGGAPSVKCIESLKCEDGVCTTK